jgi:hypothetical protein
MKLKHDLKFVVFLQEAAPVTREDALISFSVKRVALHDF